MRNLGSIILIILYAAFAIGIWVHQHNCCCKSYAEFNGVELLEQSCCKGKACHNSDCDKGGGLYLNIDDAHQSPMFQVDAFLLSRSEFITPAPFVFLEDELNSDDQETPDINGPPLYIEYSASLVYG